MTDFLSSHNITHTTSSPHFPQSNGMAERCVQTVKRLLKQSNDFNIALLNYRATPLPWCNRSPSELLMGRCIRTMLPQTTEQLTPQWSYLHDFRERDKEMKKRQKRDFDRHHCVRELPDLPEDTDVWVTSGGSLTRGQVQSEANAPRSYLVDTPTGSVRRNRSQLQRNFVAHLDSRRTPPLTVRFRDRGVLGRDFLECEAQPITCLICPMEILRSSIRRPTDLQSL